ncbi:hypothetical protein HDZ31DRAFT_82276 [Schizophyllum fasciatum]
MLHPKFHCPFSGPQQKITCCRLIPELESDVEEDDIKIVRMEWVWGLDRGGLPYYIMSTHNSLYFRPDIARIYANYGFALVPTFRTYVELVKFLHHAGVVDRDEKDMSPRRPLTAFAPPSGRYRYVFIPFTDAARQLQKEFKMQPQTEDDLNGGIHPVSSEPVVPGTDAFPVVECYAHPFSVSKMAWRALRRHAYGGLRVITQWLSLMICIHRQWTSDDVKVPHWFVEAPLREWDDVTVKGSEGSGYGLPDPNPLMRDSPCAYDWPELDTNYAEPRAKVLEWFTKTRQPCKLRRPQRREQRPSPYTSKPPAGRRRRATPIARADLHRVAEDVPEWVQKNGCFPTDEFSSNDWAYFYFGASLDGSIVDHCTGTPIAWPQG